MLASFVVGSSGDDVVLTVVDVVEQEKETQECFSAIRELNRPGCLGLIPSPFVTSRPEVNYQIRGPPSATRATASS